MRRAWHRLTPWLTPALVVVEVVLVWSGALRLGTAVLIGVAVELAIWVTVLSRLVAAIRRYRSLRWEGLDGWSAAEEGLSRMVPRRFAHVLLLEPRLWVALARWIMRRPDVAPADRQARTFRYDASLSGILLVIVLVVLVEGAAVEVVLALVLPGTAWWIASLAVHGYAVVALLGLRAGFAVRPHVVGTDGLRLRDGVFGEVDVPYQVITAVRRRERPNTGRSGFRVSADRTAILAHGDAAIELEISDSGAVTVLPPRKAVERFDTLAVTVDDADGFARLVRRRIATAAPEPRPALGRRA